MDYTPTKEEFYTSSAFQTMSKVKWFDKNNKKMMGLMEAIVAQLVYDSEPCYDEKGRNEHANNNIDVDKEIANIEELMIADMDFYIANYNTLSNYEISLSEKEMRDISVDGKVHKAKLSSDLVWFEDDIGWNYEDKAELFQTAPTIVEPKKPKKKKTSKNKI